MKAIPTSLSGVILAAFLAIGAPASGRAQVGVSLRVPGPPAIGVPIQITRQIIVEPFVELSRSSATNTTSTAYSDDHPLRTTRYTRATSRQAYSPGIGAFWLFGEQTIRGLVGGRVRRIQESSDVDDDISYDDEAPQRSTSERTLSGWTIGLVAGMEVAVSDRFALAGEITWQQSSSEDRTRLAQSSAGTGVISSEARIKGTDVTSQVILRWFPWSPRAK